MLGELKLLRLIVRSQIDAIERFRAIQHMLINKTADNLAMFENERDFMTAHFQNRTASRSTSSGVTEARIKEACIMHTEFTDQRVERRHFRCEKRRHMHRFARNEDVKLIRVEHQFTRPTIIDRLPEVENVIGSSLIDIDNSCVMLSAIADQLVLITRQIN